MGTSTFSQYTVVADISVVAVSKKAPLDKVCLLGCGITTAWGAVVKQPGIGRESCCCLCLCHIAFQYICLAGASVAVFGCGAIGLGVISTASTVGASRIIAIDVNPAKERWAKKFGAHEFINSNEIPQGKKIQDYLVELTDGGLDYTFDCTGNVSVTSTILSFIPKSKRFTL